MTDCAKEITDNSTANGSLDSKEPLFTVPKEIFMYLKFGTL